MNGTSPVEIRVVHALARRLRVLVPQLAKDEERLYLLESGGVVVATADYPANAVVDGRTWARLPDGTGAFAAGAPTPGRANTAP